MPRVPQEGVSRHGRRFYQGEKAYGEDEEGIGHFGVIRGFICGGEFSGPRKAVLRCSDGRARLVEALTLEVPEVRIKRSMVEEAAGKGV